ncbi:MAG: hypothetical protein AAF419_03730 [Pseudomonadota bacterium]
MFKRILIALLLLFNFQFVMAGDTGAATDPNLTAAQLAVQNILAENPSADAATIAAAIQAAGLSAETAVTAMVAAGIDAASAIDAVAPLFNVDPTSLVAASINVPLRIDTGTETGTESNTRPAPAGGTPILTSELIVLYQQLNSPS